jgi:hypothetical protein
MDYTKKFSRIRRSSQLLASLPWRTDCAVSPNNFSDILVAPEYQPLIEKLEALEDWEIKSDKATFAMLRVVGDEQGAGQQENLNATILFERQGSESAATAGVTPRLFSILSALRVIDVLAWIFPTGKCTTAVPHHRRSQQIGRKRVGCILPTIDF